ncbi:ABC transporter permease [uncultured Spirosoma sp.]|uniref:ABC transporter permease n=1 Tax=uncultured Spirosoma sp. TaxID=278208 RepID=UPI0025837EC9|nr:ABC transporter permease [uncultured Spirosoma sp.]
MLANYLKIAWRTLRKDKTFSLINIGGLALGLAIALLIIQYVRFELSCERDNPQASRLVRLTMDYLNGDAVSTQDTETHPPLGPRAKRELKEVINYTRAYPISEPTITVRVGNTYRLVERVFAVDSSFFSLFNYPLLRGNRTALFTQPRQAVLTESMARTYFNTLDVVGKTLTIARSKGNVLINIVGVIPDSPVNTHLKVNMLLSYPTMLTEFGETENNWDGNNTLTYVQLAEKVRYEDFERSLVAFNDRLHAEKRLLHERIISQPIRDIHLHSHKTFEVEPNGDARSVYFLLSVALLVLFSAVVNYVNLTTAKALDRAREMGLRKVVGSTQTQIRTQVFTETILINITAGLLSLLLIAFLEPVFVRVAGLPDGFNVFGDMYFWFSTGAFLLLSIVLSGFYPAFVLSSFQPVTVLKGSFARSIKGATLRKALVVFQFTITLILLVQTFVVYQQVSFLRKQDLGVSLDRTLVVKAPVKSNATNHSQFRQTLLSQAQVKAVSFSSTVPGLGTVQLSSTTGINLTDTQEKTAYNYYLTDIDTSFIDLMGLRLLAGRNFDAFTPPNLTDTTDRQLIVNEEVLRLWSIPSPREAIGRKVTFWGRQATIRGVVSNYHYESPKASYIPIIHLYSPKFDAFASVKFSGGQADEQLATLKKAYKATFPDAPFSYFFMDSEYDKQYKADDRFQQVFGALTGFAMLISCLGLFGLATFTVAKRTKEIGIRKVIGASTTNLLVLLSKDFIRTALISISIGLPITYLLVRNWLADYAARIELNWWLFAAPSLLIMLLVVISISGKTMATALMNPVKSLRSE